LQIDMAGRRPGPEGSGDEVGRHMACHCRPVRNPRQAANLSAKLTAAALIQPGVSDDDVLD
jgi:hypothetical protein